MDTHTETAPTIDLEPAARQIASLLDGIDEQQLDDPTPCPDYAVRELLAHLVGLTTAFRDAARKDFGPTTDTAPDASVPVLGDDWREVLPPLLEELVTAWREPAARQGMTRAGSVDLPAEVALLVALDELVIHGWDLARSTGQKYEGDEASLRASLAVLTPSDDNPRPESIFGPPVPVPADAPLVDRAIAMSGRRPDWEPGD
ncbi:TIGR03086 family metal-binding protein [Streptomyces sp. NBC_01005]|uniref:TIGR03086 family metal-binding protein n=1 Tax=unclassified Streptomyces TaxID=2593676 RepID=UPI002E31EC75|nr:TIGR03086 family metal-binding protein [Streptomyces sp. NBC_01362]WSW04452.1 TIGR03086 family metal-binding protein [Streptomyces sp. NBC_01005]WTC93956.1 TIGR03086 family metal-binding protein [Streptomyces sp. NBC_01650]